jgi:general secretion pathway protein K
VTRRGVALLAALWLVVAITTVGLQFGLEAREHRQLAVGVAERTRARAAARGAAATMQARLERALRMPTFAGGQGSLLRASDPWLDVDSLYSGVDTIGGVVVEVRARDLGAQLRLNELNEDQLRTFLGFVLDDYLAADEIAQAVTDWRDRDQTARPRGGEREQYEQRGLLAIPANQDFRDVDELRQVIGMTPERFAEVAPYLTTLGNDDVRVNLNSAPEPVLRALPGMTDAMVLRLLALRSNGQRLRSVNELIPGATGRPGQGSSGGGRAASRLSALTTVDTRDVLLTLVARAGPQAAPVRMDLIVRRGNGATSTIAWRSWQ